MLGLSWRNETPASEQKLHYLRTPVKIQMPCSTQCILMPGARKLKPAPEDL